VGFLSTCSGTWGSARKKYQLPSPLGGGFNGIKDKQGFSPIDFPIPSAPFTYNQDFGLKP